MVSKGDLIFACCIAAVVLVAMGAAEYLHARRIRQIRHLVFDRMHRRGRLALLAPSIAVLGAVALTWGIATLWMLPAERFDSGSLATPAVDPNSLKRVVILLDVSPSMDIQDADHSRLTRRGRAAAVILDMLSRFAFDQSRVSVLDFFTSVKPVVIDTIDPNVVRYVVGNDDVSLAFEDGQTDLVTSINGAFDLIKDWRPGSTTLVVLTDGDSASTTPLVRRPLSLEHVIFVGVGDPNHGTEIDGHLSRQVGSGLAQLASRLNGTYFDANENLLPTDLLADSTGPMSQAQPPTTPLRIAGMSAIGIGSIALLALPIGLAFFGRPPRRKQQRMGLAALASQPMRGAA